jgi:hypothetical protein
MNGRPTVIFIELLPCEGILEEERMCFIIVVTLLIYELLMGSEPSRALGLYAAHPMLPLPVFGSWCGAPYVTRVTQVAASVSDSVEYTVTAMSKIKKFLDGHE